MRRTLAAFACMASFLVAGSAGAAVINGQFVPDSIVGQKDGNGNYIKYRLIFVTAGETDADSPNVGIYQTFVNNQVAGSMLAGAVYDWKPVVSTYGGWTATQSVGSSETAIYNTGGFKVADGKTDLLDGTLDVAVQYNQFGASVGDARVWSGSYASGNSHMGGNGLPLYNFTLGSERGAPPLPDNTVFGYANQMNSTWLDSRSSMPNGPIVNGQGGIDWNTARIYGISGELSAIPEPASLVMWSVAAGVAGLAVWRKRRGNR